MKRCSKVNLQAPKESEPIKIEENCKKVENTNCGSCAMVICVALFAFRVSFSNFLLIPFAGYYPLVCSFNGCSTSCRRPSRRWRMCCLLDLFGRATRKHKEKPTVLQRRLRRTTVFSDCQKNQQQHRHTRTYTVAQSIAISMLLVLPKDCDLILSHF